MTTFLLIRHGAHLLGSGLIAGRKPGVRLSPLGYEQVARMVERVATHPVSAVYSSPMERARQTAEPLATRRGVPLQISEALTEVDFGEWSGIAIGDLKPLERWKRWNAFRSGAAPPPGGERMLEVQARIVGEILPLRDRHGDAEVVALVSHGDPIRVAVAYFLGVPIDFLLRIEIGLASVSAVRLGDYGPHVLCINGNGDWPTA